jgi:hypothetical protein
VVPLAKSNDDGNSGGTASSDAWVIAYSDKDEWFYPDGGPRRRKTTRHFTMRWKLAVALVVTAGAIGAVVALVR